MTSHFWLSSRRILGAYVAGLILVCPVWGAEPTVSLKVSPTISTAPTKIRFTVTIEPNAANRKACLAFDGAEAGMSCWQIDGDTHPRTQWFERRIGAGGDYFATVTLVSVVCDEKQHCTVKHTSDAKTFIVTEPGVPFVR